MAGRVRISREEAASLVQRPGPRGTTRQYVNPSTGEVYSRRQAEQAQVAYGLRAAPQQGKPLTRYGVLIKERQDYERREGLNRSRREIRNDSATKAAVKGINDKRDKSAQGKLARSLVYFGRRDPAATYDVGDTP